MLSMARLPVSLYNAVIEVYATKECQFQTIRMAEKTGI